VFEGGSLTDFLKLAGVVQEQDFPLAGAQQQLHVPRVLVRDPSVAPEVIAEVLVVALQGRVDAFELFIDELVVSEHIVADDHYVVVVHGVE